MTGSTTSSTSPTDGHVGAATKACPSGKVVVGGGGEINTSNNAIRNQVVMFRSFPSAADAWTASAADPSGFSGQTVTVTAYAICANAS